MTKDVLISISGLQMDVLEEEKEYEAIEVVAPANYFLKNGKHYILFDEVTEGIPGITKNRIKITGEDALEVMKSGVSNVHMVFEKNKKEPHILPDTVWTASNRHPYKRNGSGSVRG